jgi:4-hydroxybenzoate polyprenyltransferase
VRRPLAAGEVSASQARAVLSVLLVAIAVGLAFIPDIAPGIVAYLGVNVAYSLRLKHVPVVDLFCVGSGFMLRVWVGAVAIGVPLSSWMLITTLCLALYLASVKRHQELAQNGSHGRSVLDAYSLPLLQRYTEVAAIGTFVFYGLYVTEVRPDLAITIPLVLFGIFRYSFIVETRGKGESPADALWSDPPLAATVLAWAALCVLVIYRG